MHYNTHFSLLTELTDSGLYELAGELQEVLINSQMEESDDD